MKHTRRTFIKMTGAAGLVLAAGDLSLLAAGKRQRNFGIQLYTLRDIIGNDTRNVLKQLAAYGYTQIESYEGPGGMFWGMGHKGFRDYMHELGLTLVSSHCDIHKDFERKAAEAAEIGMKYLICPWIGPQKSADDYKRFAETFNQKGEICRQNGIRFAYHNHDYSFKDTEGQNPQEILLKFTEPGLVDFEMDIYWVVTASVNPEDWFRKYKNRFRLCHIKDRSRTPVADNGKNSVDLGTGSIDWRKTLKAAVKNGMQYFIVEQEAYPNGSSLDAAKKNAAYLKKLNF
ncbi:MAG: sugar phosphate isomerase/epimerase [Chitinophagaceae bacterium]|nr:sugar phosphate isomerase/epimerase [Chitinophagaceae bacterium]